MFRGVFVQGRRFMAAGAPALAVASTCIYGSTNPSYSDCTPKPEPPAKPLSKTANENVVILSGTANMALSKQIANILNTELLDAKTRRFSDGEINCEIHESIRGKDIFIIQTCAAPVNDNIMELLLTVAAARRAGAHNVTAVIPYFGYKYHRRGLPISTTYNSRFLWSAASDLAKMLQTVGVDSVVSVDLQRPGQGHEACFFDLRVPVETISTSELFAEYFKDKIEPPLGKVVVLSANAANVKKARKFQKKLKEMTGREDIDYAVFVHDERPWGNRVLSTNELLGDVKGADVIIIDDVVDTATQLTVLCRRIVREGARRVFICASHGLFAGNCMELIDLSPVEKVIVTDSVPLPANASKKITQVSIAPLIARVLETEKFVRDRHFRSVQISDGDHVPDEPPSDKPSGSDEEVYVMEDEA